MIQGVQPTSSQIVANAMGAASPTGAGAPEVWGLSTRQLHDAFWRSKGVQCVRRGRRVRVQSGAELFLLIEPNQLVLFHLAGLVERLTWHNAAVTRLRLVDRLESRYSEHVVTDDEGRVQRVERRYGPHAKGSSRVMLTASARMAELWMTARGRREGWDRVRRSVAWARIDHWKCAGETFVEGDPAQERELILDLVTRWPHPNQVVSGLEQIEPGVWHAAGDEIPGGVVRIGPLWLGRGHADLTRPCFVGPNWTDDLLTADRVHSKGSRLKNIAEVELAEEADLEAVPAKPRLYQAGKRLFDVLAASGALMMLVPVMAVVAAMILLETGRPIFFGHLRQGRHGQVFRCWKFRTMHRDAEKRAREAGLKNLADGPQVRIENDPRVTRVGRFLRDTNLDELPQFFNVLMGQMSLVGPRPSPDDENQFCPAWRDLRLSVRPGITGLWQLKRTREAGEDFQEWIKYDIQYVQQASFAFDLQILARTARMMILRRTRDAEK